MTLSWAETTRRVVARAADRCEYCFMHQSLQGASFHVEHIIPQARSGGDHLDNLCLACPRCNLMKSDRTMALTRSTTLRSRCSTRERDYGGITASGMGIGWSP